MTATAVTGPGSNRPRVAAKLRADDGVGLVELLIALLVLNIGIFATLAAFTGGALALRRASHVSTASAIADKEMETLRDSSWATIANLPPTQQIDLKGPNTPDGRHYTVEVDASQNVSTVSGSTVTQVTVTVRDVADGNKTLVTTSSTFSQCAQDMNTTTTSCQS